MFQPPAKRPCLQDPGPGDSTFLLDDDVLTIISDQTGVYLTNREATPELSQLPFSLQIDLPTTPQGEKIEKILKQRLFKEPSNAGRLAVRLASDIFFDEKTLGESSLTGDHGKLKVLDEQRIGDIEDIVVRMYRGKVTDIKETLDKCREAISKKCQRIRKKMKN